MIFYDYPWCTLWLKAYFQILQISERSQNWQHFFFASICSSPQEAHFPKEIKQIWEKFSHKSGQQDLIQQVVSGAMPMHIIMHNFVGCIT